MHFLLLTEVSKKVLGKAKGFVIPALSQLLENDDGQTDHPGRAYNLLPYEQAIMREMEVRPASYFESLNDTFKKFCRNRDCKLFEQLFNSHFIELIDSK